MRVVLVSPQYPPGPGIGGIGTHTAAIALALASRGHFVAVVSRGDSSTMDEGDVTVVRLPFRNLPAFVPRRNLVERLWDQIRIAHACRRLRPDVVHASEWEAWAWLIARSRVPVVTHLATPTFMLDELTLGHLSSDSTVVRWMERDQARRSRKVYGPTRAIVERVGPAWKLAPGALDVLPDPVDVDQVRREGAGDPPVHAPSRAIVFNGRLEPRKGIEVLGKALPAVLLAHPDVTALVIGRDTVAEGGELMARFHRRTEPVADRVKLLGELPHAQAMAVVARATLVVLPSLWEAFGYVCVEAMALGRPVVASSGSGFAEVILDQVDGWLVPAGDADALAASLIARLADPAALESVGRAAAEKAEHFRADRLVGRLEALLEAAAGT